MAGRWLDVGQAARELGLSTDAVRKRIFRGKVVSEEQDGRRVVWLDYSGTEAGQETSATSAEVGELVKELRRNNEYLQGQVSAEREARLRADHIIARISESNAELSRAVRELEAAVPPEEHQEPSEDSAPSDAPEEPDYRARII
jgi:hypothetical protein